MLGEDHRGITEESLENLENIKRHGYILKSIVLEKERTAFYFGSSFYYIASGFSFGYGGEGPHGLWEAICLWYSDKISDDFWKSEILSLDIKNRWKWTPENGFSVFNVQSYLENI